MRSPLNEGVAPARPGEFPPVRIGDLEPIQPVILAPMAGVTDAPFRSLCRRFAESGAVSVPVPSSSPSQTAGRPTGLFVGQMVTARALLEANTRTWRMAEFAPGESPRSIQLYGTDPRYLAEATRRLVDLGRVDHIDLNFGCPAPKVTRLGGGAALPYRRPLLAEMLRATVAAAGEVPVTVKFRLGIDDDHLTFLDTGRMAEDAGCRAVALHARTAEQLYSGEARWDRISELVGHVSIPVFGNGDIWEPWDALRMLRETGCDGVVIGRGCLGRPWLFRDLAAVFGGQIPPDPPGLVQTVQIMLMHLRDMVAWYGEESAVRQFRKHAIWYLTGFPVGGELRAAISRFTSPDELEELLGGIRDVPFPATALRTRRSHKGGPRPVALPEGWLDDPDDLTLPTPGADRMVSGG